MDLILTDRMLLDHIFERKIFGTAFVSLNNICDSSHLDFSIAKYQSNEQKSRFFSKLSDFPCCFLEDHRNLLFETWLKFPLIMTFPILNEFSFCNTDYSWGNILIL